MTNTPTARQHTIADRIDLSGVGVHSGKPVSISLLPADADTGIVFQRTDIDDQRDIPARSDALCGTDLCTVLGDPAGAHVATVEHLMAALIALQVDNAVIEIDAPEVPVMDGSSEVFVRAIDAVGVTAQASYRRFLRVKREVRFDMGPSWGLFTPYDGQRFEVEIDFDTPLIGRQRFASDLTPDVFRRELSRARTFGFMNDVERLWAAGFALGSSLENSVVICKDNKIINPEGLRYDSEFVRHKALDAVGDLALAGAPILGAFRSYRGGHKLNALALRELMADPDNFEWVDVTARSRGAAPRPGLRAVAAPAYAADKS